MKMETWMTRRPVKITDLLAWIEGYEIGVIEHDETVQAAVSNWAKRKADFDADLTPTRDELTAALCAGGMAGVESLVEKRMCEAATFGMVWGAITAFQRMPDEWVEADQISAE